MGSALERGRIDRVRIRVLEILATLKRAGAERMAVSLACKLDAARFETGMVSLFDAFDGGLEPELRAADVPLWHLGKRPGLDARMFGRLRRVIQEFRPAVLHTHSYVLRYSLPASLGTRRAVMVHTVHNVAERETDLGGRMLHRVVFGRRVAAVAVGQEVRRSYREWYGAEPEATIRNGIETAGFRLTAGRQQWRAVNGFGHGDILVVSVGRLDPQKNPLLLIDAFAQAFRGDPRGQLLLVGDGSLQTAAKRKAAELGLEKHVHFLGVRADVAQVLAAGDVFALASDWEGTPLAVMEAMAAGLPVVATAVGGVPELVVDGESGVLTPAGDVQALAGALAQLAGSAALRHAMSAAASARAEPFSVEKMVSEYAALFECLVGGNQ
jgi:glycosyltransferase involved in cell wall biosynthesis